MTFFDQLPHRVIAEELGEPFTFWERVDFYFPRAARRLDRIFYTFTRRHLHP